MKKLVAMLCLAALAVSSMFAATVTSEISGQLETNGYFGAGLHGNLDKVGLDPETGLMAASFQKNFGAYYGVGSIVGSDIASLEAMDVQADNGTTYQTTCVYNGYAFALWCQDNVPTYAVYAEDEGMWTSTATLPWDLYAYAGDPQVDITYDGTNYILLVSVRTDDLAGTSLIVTYRGVVEDLYSVDDIEWTEVLKTAGDLYDGGQGQANKVAFGKDGFAAITTDRIDDPSGDGTYMHGYMVSNDYGATWNTPGVDADGYSAWNLIDIEDPEISNGIIGQTVFEADSNSVISEQPITGVITWGGAQSMNVDSENNIHISEWIYSVSDSGMDYYYNTEGKPIGGQTFWRGVKQADGTYKFTNSAIIPPVGIVKGSADAAEDPSANGYYSQYSNTRDTQITVGENGFVAYSHDDGREGALVRPDGIIGSAYSDAVQFYLEDAYAIFSKDNGATWDYGASAGGTYTGYNLTDSEGEEFAAKLSRRARMTGAGIWEFATVWGVPAFDEIIDGTTAGFDELSHDVRIMKTQVNMGVGIEEDLNVAGKEFALAQNYPNPFNPTTTLSFNVANDAKVALNVYNAQGQLVKELVNKEMKAGVHSVEFNGADLNSGVYFYKLNVNGNVATKKMVLTK